MSRPRYSVLDKTKASIRLLTLHPAQNRSSAPRCTLSVTSIDLLPDFEALSYTWGSPIEGDTSYESPASDKMIELDNAPFIIRKNLYEALIRLRFVEKDRALWIDAICIDQTNVEERNHQVRQMAQIYKSAQQVIVWLGEKDQYTDDAIDWLANLVDMQGYYDKGGLIPDDYVISDHCSPEGMDRLIQCEEYVLKWNALQHLVGRSWWKRVWTIQELALASSLTVKIGDVEIRWDTFDTAFRGISPRHDTLQACLSLAKKSEAIEQVLNWGRPLNHWSLRHITSIETRDHSAGLDPLATGTVHSDDTFKKWYTVLQGTTSAQCFDNRDHIYGILGLCDASIRSSIPVDYTLSAPMLFRKATYQLISGLQSLSVLTNRSLETCFKVFPPDTVPSWVPQQRHTDYIAKIDSQPDAYAPHQASLKTNCHAVISDEYSTLIAKGLIPDTISRLGEPVRDCSAPPMDVFRIWSSVLDLENHGGEIYRHRTKGFYYNSDFEEQHEALLTIREIFWLVITMGYLPGHVSRKLEDGERRIFHIGRDPRRDHPRLREYASCRYPPRSEEEISNFMWMMTNNHEQNQFQVTPFSRRLFVTRNGFIGMGPESAQEGDVVAILHGSRVPYVLRKDPSGLRYRFLDECYVQGMMQGEMIEDQASGKYDLESIALY